MKGLIVRVLLKLGIKKIDVGILNFPSLALGWLCHSEGIDIIIFIITISIEWS